MKQTAILLLVALVAASCKSNVFVQVYTAKPHSNLLESGDVIQYEDEQCLIVYNLWGEGGNMGFRFYNKTDHNIYLNLEETFFIRNGMASNYYKNRIYSSSSSFGSSVVHDASKSKYTENLEGANLQKTRGKTKRQSVEIINTSQEGISFYEEKVAIIPAKTSKYFQEYTVVNTLHRDCDLKRYPKGKRKESKTFTPETSPLVFSNRITYIVGNRGTSTKIENSFYVAEIANLSEKAATELKNDVFCDQKSQVKTKQFVETGANKFYIRYAKNRDYWTH